MITPLKILDVGYVSLKLLNHLASCAESVDLSLNSIGKRHPSCSKIRSISA
jgi:hypothetical protein